MSIKMTAAAQRTLLAGIVALAAALSLLPQTDYFAARAQPATRTEGSAVKIYLAGPLGFSEAGRYFYDRGFVPMVKAAGFVVLDPWALTSQSEVDAVANMPDGPARRAAWRELNVKIAGRNAAALDECDAVVAILDGVDVDSGTAAEIGYAFAKGRPILGYRGDFRLSADNEGAKVNLQVEYFIRQSGGDIITAIDKLPEALERLKTAARKRRQ
jgi:nucleoside 2-deoxyribosyltransferase